jgi:hypothetical protein
MTRGLARIGIAILAALLCGCSVMNFSNGPGPLYPANKPDATKWRHTFVQGVLEAGRPVDPKAHCRGDWSLVSTQETLGTGLISLAQYFPTALITSGMGVMVPLKIWDVQNVEIRCAAPDTAARP